MLMWLSFSSRPFAELYLSGTDNLLDVQLLWSKLERKEAAKKSKVSHNASLPCTQIIALAVQLSHRYCNFM